MKYWIRALGKKINEQLLVSASTQQELVKELSELLHTKVVSVSLSTHGIQELLAHEDRSTMISTVDVVTEIDLLEKALCESDSPRKTSTSGAGGSVVSGAGGGESGSGVPAGSSGASPLVDVEPVGGVGEESSESAGEDAGAQPGAEKSAGGKKKRTSRRRRSSADEGQTSVGGAGSGLTAETKAATPHVDKGAEPEDEPPAVSDRGQIKSVVLSRERVATLLDLKYGNAFHGVVVGAFVRVKERVGGGYVVAPVVDVHNETQLLVDFTYFMELRHLESISNGKPKQDEILSWFRQQVAAGRPLPDPEAIREKAEVIENGERRASQIAQGAPSPAGPPPLYRSPPVGRLRRSSSGDLRATVTAIPSDATGSGGVSPTVRGSLHRTKTLPPSAASAAFAAIESHASKEEGIPPASQAATGSTSPTNATAPSVTSSVVAAASPNTAGSSGQIPTAVSNKPRASLQRRSTAGPLFFGDLVAPRHWPHLLHLDTNDHLLHIGISSQHLDGNVLYATRHSNHYQLHHLQKQHRHRLGGGTGSGGNSSNNPSPMKGGGGESPTSAGSRSPLATNTNKMTSAVAAAAVSKPSDYAAAAWRIENGFDAFVEADDTDISRKGYKSFGSPTEWRGQYWCLCVRHPRLGASPREAGTTDTDPRNDKEESPGKNDDKVTASTTPSGTDVLVLLSGASPCELSSPPCFIEFPAVGWQRTDSTISEPLNRKGGAIEPEIPQEGGDEPMAASGSPRSGGGAVSPTAGGRNSHASAPQQQQPRRRPFYHVEAVGEVLYLFWTVPILTTGNAASCETSANTNNDDAKPSTAGTLNGLACACTSDLTLKHWTVLSATGPLLVYRSTELVTVSYESSKQTWVAAVLHEHVSENEKPSQNESECPPPLMAPPVLPRSPSSSPRPVSPLALRAPPGGDQPQHDEEKKTESGGGGSPSHYHQHIPAQLTLDELPPQFAPPPPTSGVPPPLAISTSRRSSLGPLFAPSTTHHQQPAGEGSSALPTGASPGTADSATNSSSSTTHLGFSVRYWTIGHDNLILSDDCYGCGGITTGMPSTEATSILPGRAGSADDAGTPIQSKCCMHEHLQSEHVLQWPAAASMSSPATVQWVEGLKKAAAAAILHFTSFTLFSVPGKKMFVALSANSATEGSALYIDRCDSYCFGGNAAAAATPSQQQAQPFSSPAVGGGGGSAAVSPQRTPNSNELSPLQSNAPTSVIPSLRRRSLSPIPH